MELILNDAMIEWLGQTGVIFPFCPLQVNPASYDLTLGDDLLVPNSPRGRHIDPTEGVLPVHQEWSLLRGGPFRLFPGKTVLATTAEQVSLPADLVGEVVGKSSRMREGLNLLFAGYVDPGFAGNITLELHNVGPSPYILSRGLRIAQINFKQMAAAAVRPYGHPDRRSKYHGQVGVTASRGH